MTRDAAAQAVHERLEHVAASMAEPDIEAGWAALVAQLEPPVAPVVPLRRPRPRRAIVLGVAAAILIGGGAFAMVRHAAGYRPGSDYPVVTMPGAAAIGPHTHPALSGPPAEHHVRPSRAGGDRRHGSAGPSGGSVPSSDRAGDSHAGRPHPDGTHAFHHDAADDTDHGTGNDGTHDDNGQGNDAQGQDRQGQDSRGNGSSSSGGSGNDHGSSGGQGSGDRGTGSGGGHASHGEGPGSEHGSNGK